MLELSIVLPTCNRAPLLAQCLQAIEASVSCSHEIIVVDGASTDHTAEVLADAAKSMGDRLRTILEPQREGFVKAANKGFRAARGRTMTWLNDDARPLPGALDAAIVELNSQPPNVGFVAMFHRWDSPWNVAYEQEYEGKKYKLCHVRGTLYANFPLGRREVYERLDYFDERFYLCGADPDLSLKAWYAGLSIVPAFSAIIDHDEVEDARRIADSARRDADNKALFAKWDLPPRSPGRNFDPRRPFTVRRAREVQTAAA